MFGILRNFGIVLTTDHNTGTSQGRVEKVAVHPCIAVLAAICSRWENPADTLYQCVMLFEHFMVARAHVII